MNLKIIIKLFPRLKLKKKSFFDHILYFIIVIYKKDLMQKQTI